MMAITLTGAITDVTAQPVSQVTNVTAKAAVPTPSATGLTATQPVNVEYTAATGQITISLTEGVKTWLYIEGPGWSDSVPLIAAAGMTKIWQAVVNALGIPTDIAGMLDVTKNMQDLLNEAIRNAPSSLWWYKGNAGMASADLLGDGLWSVWSGTQAKSMGLPVEAQGLIQSVGWSQSGFQRFQVHDPVMVSGVVWVRVKHNGVWQKWVRESSDLDHGFPYLGKSTDTTASTADDLPAGIVEVWSGAEATRLQLPAVLTGLVTTKYYGTNGTQIFEAVSPMPGESKTFVRTKTQYGWGEWVDTSANGSGAGVAPGGASPAGLKVVPSPLTLGDGDSGHMPANGSFRIPMKFGAKVTRWRVGFTLRAPRYEMVHNIDATITDIGFAPHSSNGAFAQSPARLARGLVVPKDGQAAYTPWTTRTMDANAEYLLSYSYTSTGAKTPPGNLGGGWDAGQATAMDVAPSGMTRVSQLPFDIWVELEVESDVPVIAVVGDSITCGANATLPVFDAWGSVYARRIGGIATLYGTSGDTGKSWADNPTYYKATRFMKPHLSRPDAVVWAMGRNDFSGGTTDADMRVVSATAAEFIQQNLSPNVFAVTITPRNTGEGDAERAKYNTWLLNSQTLFRDVFDFAAVVDDGTGQIKPEYNADGLHLNTAGYAQLAGAVNTPIISPTGHGALAAYMKGKGL